MLVLNVFRTMVIALVLMGCSRANERSTSKVIDGWRRGDVAIIESTAAEFFESQVLEVSPGKLKVQRTQGGDSLLVGAGDAYRIAMVSPHSASDAWAICQLRTHEWAACRVSRSGPSINGEGTTASSDPSWVYDVIDAHGNEHQLKGAGVVIEPTGLTAMNIQRRFEQSLRRANFERSFREAGKVRRPSGWQPAPRRLVLASRQGQWFGAVVVEVDDNRAVVRWDGQKEVTDLPKEDVAPQPPACGQAVRGDRALRRPTGHGAAWAQVVVMAVDGADVTVEDVDRVRTTIQLRDICPFGSPNSPPPAK